MAADGKLVQGEVTDNPQAMDSDEAEVKRMLEGFMRALIAEQAEQKEATS